MRCVAVRCCVLPVQRLLDQTRQARQAGQGPQAAALPAAPAPPPPAPSSGGGGRGAGIPSGPSAGTPAQAPAAAAAASGASGAGAVAPPPLPAPLIASGPGATGHGTGARISIEQFMSAQAAPVQQAGYSPPRQRATRYTGEATECASAWCCCALPPLHLGLCGRSGCVGSQGACVGGVVWEGVPQAVSVAARCDRGPRAAAWLASPPPG